MWQRPPRRVLHRNSNLTLTPALALLALIPFWLLGAALIMAATAAPLVFVAVIPWFVALTCFTRRTWHRLLDTDERGGACARKLVGAKRGRRGGQVLYERKTPANLAWRRRGWLVMLRARDRAPAFTARSFLASISSKNPGEAFKAVPLRRLKPAGRTGSDLESGRGAGQQFHGLVCNLVCTGEDAIFREMILYI